MAGGKKKSKHDRPKKVSGKKDGGQGHVVEAVEPEAPVVADVVTEVAAPSAEPARRGALTEMVPVRFDPQMLADVRQRAADDHRSVSSWIRRAVDLELQRGRS
jgi:hypothetical protein